MAAMQLSFSCPACEHGNRVSVTAESPRFACSGCGRNWDVPVEDLPDGRPARCLCCGNADLWRQKDFPQTLGFIMVALGAVLSSIAWAYHYPVLALSILAGFGLLDMAFYLVMPDVLVCYRCRARHSVAKGDGEFESYNHELGERYRQERLRLEAQPSGSKAEAAAG
jgi:hypothetical protein